MNSQSSVAPTLAAVSSLLILVCNAEANALKLSFSTNTIAETQIDGATTATVRISPAQTNDLSVGLVSDIPDEIHMPPAIIPAGSNQVTFAVAGVNNPFITGPVTVTVVASAKNFTDAQASITVLDDDAPGYLTLGGYFAGHLTNSIYHVTGNLTVDVGETLAVDPGSTLLFGAGVGMTNAGTLLAVGVPKALVRFLPDNASPTNGDWFGLVVTGPHTALGYAEIGFAQYGLRVLPVADNPGLSLSNSAVHDCSGYGVGLHALVQFHGGSNINSKSQVRSNAIYGNLHDGVFLYSFTTPDGAHEYCASSDNAAVVDGNAIYANGNAGIEILVHAVPHIRGCNVNSTGHNSSVITNNVISGNEYGIYANAQCFSDWIGDLRTKIVNNLVVSNGFGGLWLVATNRAEFRPVIINNTVAYNGNAGILHWWQTAPGFTMENNLVVGNPRGVSASDDYTPTNAIIAGNDVWGSSVADWFAYPIDFGNLVSTNLNSTPQDLSANISADPRFLAPGDFRLQADSPAIDAGLINNAPATDITGFPRQGLPDVGCYESRLRFVPLWRAGVISLEVTGGRGTSFILQSSTNLVDWINVTNLTLSGRSLRVTLPQGPNEARVFLRGVN